MAKAEAKKKEAALPKTPAACADLLYRTREDRLKLQKEVERMKALETRLSEYFINTLPKSDATGISGRLATVRIEPKDVPQVEDWDAFYKYVKRTGQFELLQRRLAEGAVKERWADKKEVPGVGVFHAKTVSCTKR